MSACVYVFACVYVVYCKNDNEKWPLTPQCKKTNKKLKRKTINNYKITGKNINHYTMYDFQK